ncbi:MAG: serine/threonine-protein phosphatase [Candidatus Symbiopectobacterium sp. Clec_Harlan]|uniref:metallophosphoesterase n=1 Tax=Symbiopectobacterium sp. TaxID=2952789 RepID=UPI0006CF1A80|nr:serine/threonine-protein phosphatase [Candidatus Symbiopectobacterium sp. Clec_Harlan]
MREIVRYRSIRGDDYRHVWVVGDLHGCYQQLKQQLIARKFDERCDLLIAVGDLIDRGTDSAACLALLDAPWFISVAGNHECMAYAALQGESSDHWRNNGGDWYFELSPIHRHSIDRLIQLTESLPHVLEVNVQTCLYVIAHADYPSARYDLGLPVNVDDVVWGRRRLLRAQSGDYQRIEGADRFIFGHTPLKKVCAYANQKKVCAYANQIYLDTGAVYGGPLSMVRLR